MQPASDKSLRGSKPVVWLHGIVEEDPLVGFREQQMRLIEEHFTVVTHRELGETGAAHPGIQGAISVSHRADWFHEHLPLMPNLRAVAVFGSGTNHLNLELLNQRGIKVSRTPHATSAAVADLAMALLLGAARNVVRGVGVAMQKDPVDKFSDNDFGLDVTGTTVGIIGMGGIGTLIAKRCTGFDMTILYHNHRPRSEPPGFEAEFCANLDSMLPRCDYVIISCPLTEQTRGLIGESKLLRMKRGAVLVNVARGEIVDHLALAHALEAGHLQGAALDVTSPEPLPRDHPLLGRSDVIITPHYGAAVLSTRLKMTRMCVDSLREVLDP